MTPFSTTLNDPGP